MPARTVAPAWHTAKVKRSASNAVTTPGVTTRKAILSLGRARNILRGLTKLRWG